MHRYLVVANRTLSGLLVQAGEDARALEVARDELNMVDDVAFRDRVLSMVTASGMVMDVGADFEAAVDLAERALPMARELSAHDRMHATYFLMAPLYRLGRWEAILGHGRDRPSAQAIVNRADAVGFPGAKLRPDPCGGFEVYIAGFDNQSEAQVFVGNAKDRGFAIHDHQLAVNVAPATKSSAYAR